MSIGLDALAAEVAAVLDQFANGESWSTEECIDSATFHEFRALTWAAKDDPRLLARTARNAFSTVYAHVNGQGGEAEHGRGRSERAGRE